MKIPFDQSKTGWRYPWAELRQVGDYFDIQAADVPRCGGVRNAAFSHGNLTTSTYRTFTLADGTVRVMLVDSLDDRHTRQVTAVTRNTSSSE